MRVNKTSETITWVTRDDETKCMIAKMKSCYEVYINGHNSGYKFRSHKKL